MRFLPFRGPVSKYPATFSGRVFVARLLLPGLLLCGMTAFAVFAQEKSIIRPEASRPPDANDQIKMREAQGKTKNFDAVNAERLKQMMLAADMMETMAIALKEEVDKSGSDSSPEEIRKAETIEKLARIVKERMKMTIAPN